MSVLKRAFSFYSVAPQLCAHRAFSRQSYKGWMQDCSRNVLRHHGQKNMVKAMWSTKWEECQEQGWAKFVRGFERFLRAAIRIGMGRQQAKVRLCKGWMRVLSPEHLQPDNSPRCAERKACAVRAGRWCERQKCWHISSQHSVGAFSSHDSEIQLKAGIWKRKMSQS